MANDHFSAVNNYQLESECLWVSGCASGDGDKCTACQDGYYLVTSEIHGTYWNKTYADDPWATNLTYGFMRNKGLNLEGSNVDSLIVSFTPINM